MPAPRTSLAWRTQTQARNHRRVRPSRSLCPWGLGAAAPGSHLPHTPSARRPHSPASLSPGPHRPPQGQETSLGGSAQRPYQLRPLGGRVQDFKGPMRPPPPPAPPGLPLCPQQLTGTTRGCQPATPGTTVWTRPWLHPGPASRPAQDLRAGSGPVSMGVTGRGRGPPLTPAMVAALPGSRSICRGYSLSIQRCGNRLGGKPSQPSRGHPRSGVWASGAVAAPWAPRQLSGERDAKFHITCSISESTGSVARPSPCSPMARTSAHLPVLSQRSLGWTGPQQGPLQV